MGRLQTLAIERTALGAATRRAPSAPVHLGREAAVTLGPLRIEPALRRVSRADGQDTILQPRVMQVLVALARAEGAIVSRDDLLAACWHGVTVGEDALNRVIGQLRKLCEALSDGELRIETVAKVGYRLVGAIAAPASASVVVAPEIGPVLAVLAFDNLSGDPDFLYFSDGVSEEILLTLTKTTGLKVLGRSSSFQFRGAEKSARRVADELGASHVLDGSVRRNGDDLRITVELVDAASGATVWSDRFDRRLADVFALQDEIAARVASALQLRFAPSAAAGPIDPVAYDLYLRARQEGPDRHSFDIESLERVVELAPDFGRAWALLAFAHSIHLRWTDQTVDEMTLRRRKIQACAQRALDFDPAATDAYLAMEVIEPICGAYGKKRALIERALALTPNDAVTLVHMAGILDTLGYQRLAYGHIARAYRLDPRYAAFYYPYILEGVGLVHEARAAIARDLARWPNVDTLIAVSLRFAAEAEDWETYDAQYAALSDWALAEPIVLMLHGMSQRFRDWTPAIGDRMLADLRAYLAHTGTIPIGGLGSMCRLGLTEEVYAILEQASFAHLHQIDGRMGVGDVALTVIYTPGFAALRRDPRFVGLCVKLGLARYWADTDHWPDFASEVAPFYDLREEVRRRLAA